MTFGPVQFKVHSEVHTYKGPELKPHFLLSKWGYKGSCLVSFVGPCKVVTSDLVDWEDKLNHDHIEAKEMIHFIGEFFGMGLREGVLFQRLFIATAGELLNGFFRANKSPNKLVTRSGDDLFFGDSKLSVSIVTVSPVSVLFHAGINIDSTGAPVKAAGLKDLLVETKWFQENIMKKVAEEWESIDWACVKVRPVV